MSRSLPCTFLVNQSPSSPDQVVFPEKTLKVDDRVSNRAWNDRFNNGRLRALELIHKFSTETYKSVSNDPSDYHIWQIIIPQKALDFDFLMCGILAIASLHSAATVESSEAASMYIDTALEYHSSALSSYRKAVENINFSNCDAIYAHSIIIAAISLAMPRSDDADMTSAVYTMFELVQGIKGVANFSESWFQSHLYKSMRDFWNVPGSTLDNATEAALTKLRSLSDDFASDINQRRILQDAISVLDHCFRRFGYFKDIGSVFQWFAEVDKEFIHLLKCHSPIAWLSVVYWGVLFGQLDGKVWWATNSGALLVSGLLDLLDLGDSRLEDAILWPKEKLGLR